MRYQTNGHNLLEVSIVNALKSTQSSSEIGALIDKVAADIVATEQEANSAEARAVDIVASADAGAAMTAAAAARQRYDRLVAVLPRLHARYQEVQAQEYSAQWTPRFQEVAAERDAFEAAFDKHIANAINSIVEFIRHGQAINAKVSQINLSAPATEMRRVPEIDLRWTNNLRLVDPATGEQLWPDPRVAIEAALLVSSAVPHYDPQEWWKRNEERQLQHQKANEEMAKHYGEQTALQEKRQNRELNERR